MDEPHGEESERETVGREEGSKTGNSRGRKNRARGRRAEEGKINGQMERMNWDGDGDGDGGWETSFLLLLGGGERERAATDGGEGEISRHVGLLRSCDI